MSVESPFSKIPSQLDQIPQDAPVVFISYSWDSDEHMSWVGQLSKDLREKFRVNTLLDRYNRGGDDLITFMQKGLSKADRVLIVGTPKYKEKTEKQAGGAKFEDQVISIELYKNMETRKFIPVLREGSFSDSFSNLIETRTGYDMRDDGDYDNKLMELAADIWGVPMNTAPMLGAKPNFAPASQTLQPLTAATPVDFATIVKMYIPEPSKRILLTELIENERDVVFDKIMSHASYNYQLTPEIFNTYMGLHQEAIANLLAAMLPIVRYGTAEQQQLLVDAMVKLCTKPFREGEQGVVETENVHLLAATFLYHATGAAAVKYERYGIIKKMMEAIVPAPNVFSRGGSETLENMAGCNHWDANKLNDCLYSSWLYPYSQMVMSSIKTCFCKVFIDDNDFTCCYYAWEHFASLLCNYYNQKRFKENWFPLGGFVNKRISLLRHEDDFYTNFFKKAENDKNSWMPLKCGLFGGEYSNYKTVYDRAEDFYNRHRY